ncbi:arginine-ornithine antiporter [Lentilactobacillus kosonis]|uniref:Arginine-ornithine antiporter n=1 Tax=Lentilactobacillus kosonis TaxID=2810561 RepID=A0A401FM06_9LACO|nr:arginine-ornithine antiporter [Lentilactobacillus kosonis]GAY73419.1 arginine/ornithine antiporter ArcD [Lentilactobacillus kosonis]
METNSHPQGNPNGIGFMSLTAMVVTSSIGAGVFALTSDLASAASPGPALLAWLIVGVGIMALALSLMNLVGKRPDIEGVFAYAEEGFGEYAGFISGWGYWLSSWMGNVAFATVMMSAIGYFIPIFKSGHNVPSIIVASCVSWILMYIVNRGVESAAVLNAVITICKLIPLFTFIVFAIIMFKGNIFTAHFWNNLSGNFNGGAGVGTQIKNCLMVLMWVFVGIEGATMMSSRAKRKSDVGKATVLGLCCLLIIYILASILPYGYMSQSQLATINQPAMVYIFKDMVGTWGGAVISAGLFVSTLGSWLSWTMLPAETVRLMSEHDLLPKRFGKENRQGAPTFSLVISGLLIQAFLCTLIFTDQAYNFAYSLCTAAIVVSYILVAAYQVKYSIQNIHEKGNVVQLIIGLVALIFETVAIYLAGLQYLLLCCIAYIPGFFLFMKGRHNKHNRRWLSKREIITTLVILAGAIGGLILIFTGNISF